MRQNPPSIIPGRKGRPSVADALVAALWPSQREREAPLLSIKILVEECNQRIGCVVQAATVRSTLYRHNEIFERVGTSPRSVLYRLTKNMINKHEK